MLEVNFYTYGLALIQQIQLVMILHMLHIIDLVDDIPDRLILSNH